MKKSEKHLKRKRFNVQYEPFFANNVENVSIGDSLNKQQQIQTFLILVNFYGQKFILWLKLSTEFCFVMFHDRY